MPDHARLADRLTAVKWRNWKMHVVEQANMFDVRRTLAIPRIFDLLTGLKEKRDVAIYNGCVADPMLKIVADLESRLPLHP